MEAVKAYDSDLKVMHTPIHILSAGEASTSTNQHISYPTGVPLEGTPVITISNS